MTIFSDAWYRQLAEGAKAINTDPRDLLVIFASESALNPASTRGTAFHGFNTMGKSGAVAAGIDPDLWERLPDETPEVNLAASLKFFDTNLRRYGRSGFANALDGYLFNYAPAIWQTRVSPDTTIYDTTKGDAYYHNATMDNFPVLVSYANSRGMPFRNVNDIKSAAIAALKEGGVLKGKITVNDLRLFVLRPSNKGVWFPHVQRLTALGLAPTKSVQSVSYGGDEYNPDVPWSDFDRGRQERSHGPMPSAPSPEKPVHSSVGGDLLTGGAVIGAGYAIKKLYDWWKNK